MASLKMTPWPQLSGRATRAMKKRGFYATQHFLSDPSTASLCPWVPFPRHPCDLTTFLSFLESPFPFPILFSSFFIPPSSSLFLPISGMRRWGTALALILRWEWIWNPGSDIQLPEIFVRESSQILNLVADSLLAQTANLSLDLKPLNFPKVKIKAWIFLAELALPLLGGNKGLNPGQIKRIKHLIY